jgi:hypothetical protein
MNRCRLLLTCVTALAVAVAPASAAGAKAPPRDSLTAFACQTAMDPPNRSVAVKAVMRPVAGTRALSLSFDLVQKAGGVSRRLSGAGDLGIWLSPRDPTLGRRPGDVWELTKAVSNLDAPATYRFRVTFRWLGAHGKVLATAVRRSAACSQRELRPDVLVRSVSVTAIAHHPHKQRYAAVIANAGASRAGPFQVLFTPGDGSALQTRAIARVDAHSTVGVSFVGPVCNPGSPPTLVADSTGAVDDSDRDNNALTVTCPA